MANQQHTGLRRISNAIGYSWQGLKACYQHEAAFRQELLLCLVLMPIALWLGDNGIERALMIGSLFLIVIVELLNSSIEAVVDRTGTEFHELSGRAKDIGSAAVLISIVNASVIWFFMII